MKNTKALDKIKKQNGALVRATHIIQAVSKVGFQWPNLTGPLKKVEEELAELKFELKAKKPSPAKIESELGDLLFTICNLAYMLKIPPEQGLHKMLDRFSRRFNYVEKCVKKSGHKWNEFSLADLDYFWDQAKKNEKIKKHKSRRT
jgi:tetrapyrrole methylase family protein/MazG family protein